MALYNLKFTDDIRPSEVLVKTNGVFEHPRVGDRYRYGKKRYKVKDVIFSAAGGPNDTVQDAHVMMEETTEKGSYLPLLAVRG